MKLSALFLLLPLLCCQCKSQRTVKDGLGGGLSGANVGGRDMLESKYAGNWKPEDASWYSSVGETDKKKIAEAEKKVKRSSFETRVTETRREAIHKMDNQWENRAGYHKEFSGTKQQKKFQWPWEKRAATTKESTLAKSANLGDKTPRELGRTSREQEIASRYEDQSFATRGFNNRESEVNRTRNLMPDREPNKPFTELIMNDREKETDDGWSISDVRKLLNKS
jgi:hypothetical protein